MIRQGEIRRRAVDGRTPTVVIVSNDAWNERLRPLVAPIVRNQPDAPPAIVGLHESDPYAGGVVLVEIAAASPGELSDPVGIVTGLTMQRIRDAFTQIVAD